MILFLGKGQKSFPQLLGGLLPIGRAEMDIVANEDRGGWITWHEPYMNPSLIDVEENVVAKAVPLMNFFEIGYCSLDKISKGVNCFYQRKWGGSLLLVFAKGNLVRIGLRQQADVDFRKAYSRLSGNIYIYAVVL